MTRLFGGREKTDAVAREIRTDRGCTALIRFRDGFRRLSPEPDRKSYLNVT